MPLPLTMYGATHCEDTQHVREQLTAWLIPLIDVNIDHDAAAEQFVIFINGGQRRTPTLVVGSSDRKTILTEPGDDLLKATLLDSGYAPGYPQPRSATDDATLLKYILFDIRGCLSALSGIAMLARDSKVNLPVSVTNWLKKWQPAIETWQQTQD
ncbi:partial Putative glutaredoxin.1, partial [Gammaproteobacteria bacterium]